MIILLLCEPRSGSTNLANWFFKNKNFTVLFLPSDPKSKWYVDKIDKYQFKTDNLLIKEDFYTDKNYEDYIKLSDKIILLFRENENEQVESWVNAKKTNIWHKEWIHKDTMDVNEVNFFKNLKSSFREKFINKDYFKISYEELYYKNGFQKILDYVNLDELKNENFPIGKKYRVEINKSRTLI